MKKKAQQCTDVFWWLLSESVHDHGLMHLAHFTEIHSADRVIAVTLTNYISSRHNFPFARRVDSCGLSYSVCVTGKYLWQPQFDLFITLTKPRSDQVEPRRSSVMLEQMIFSMQPCCHNPRRWFDRSWLSCLYGKSCQKRPRDNFALRVDPRGLPHLCI